MPFKINANITFTPTGEVDPDCKQKSEAGTCNATDASEV